MNQVFEVCARIAQTVNSDRIRSAADSLAAGKSETIGQMLALVGSDSEVLQVALQDGSVTPRELAVALRAALQTADLLRRDSSLEIVWTGPKSGFVPVRDTEQVLLQVMQAADSDLFIVSYVFHRAPSIVNAAISALGRGARVRILIESSDKHGGTIQGDSVASIAGVIPNAEVYVWDRAAKLEHAEGSGAAVHAKCAVADDRMAFITSANLTTAAMERNMELGLLVRGGEVPRKLQRHLNALVTTGAIKIWDV